MEENDLNALATAFKRGDEKSFKLLVEALTRSLMAMAYRYTDDWDWARDLAQDTWIKVFRKIGGWDEARPFSSWIYAIHRNGCIDHVRRGWVRLESTPGDGAITRLSGSTPGGPEADLERREFHTRLTKAVAQLSESQRQVFLRVDLEQGDQKAVAKALGIAFATLRTTLHFARKRMAHILTELEKTT